MWRIQIKLIGLLLVILFIEITLTPLVHSSLRIDLFLGMVMGLVVYSRFAPGFLFVILATMVLQAFTGARYGYLPFAYILAFAALDLLKNLFFLENIIAQVILAFFLNLIIIAVAGFFIQLNLLQEGILPLLCGAILTAACAPVVAQAVKAIWSGHDAA